MFYLFIFNFLFIMILYGFSGGSVVKKSPANAGDPDLIPGLGKSPGGGNGNPFQYSYRGNPMDREACWATVHCCCSVSQSCPTLYNPVASLPLTNSQSWPKFMSVALVMPSSHLIPLLLPSILPRIWDFSNELASASFDKNAGTSS